MNSDLRPLRAGIIGCGRIAGSIQDEVLHRPDFRALPYGHAPAYQQARGVELVAAADPQDGVADAFARRWGVPSAYRSLDEMLAAEHPDIVSICAPSRHHTELFLAAAEHPSVRGIYLEKPVALSLGDAARMRAAAAASGVVVVVNHFRTFDPVWRQIRRLIVAGHLGEIRAVQVRWVEGWSFGGSHLFDLLRHLLDETPVSVYAVSDDDPHGDNGGTALLRYESGVTVGVTMPLDAPGTEIVLYGTAGRIVVDEHGPKIFRRRDGLEILEPFPSTMHWTSGMVTAVEELVAAVHTGSAVSSDLEAGISALEIAVAINRSVASGLPERFPVADDTWIVPSI